MNRNEEDGEKLGLRDESGWRRRLDEREEGNTHFVCVNYERLLRRDIKYDFYIDQKYPSSVNMKFNLSH